MNSFICFSHKCTQEEYGTSTIVTGCYRESSVFFAVAIRDTINLHPHLLLVLGYTRMLALLLDGMTWTQHSEYFCKYHYHLHATCKLMARSSLTISIQHKVLNNVMVRYDGELMQTVDTERGRQAIFTLVLSLFHELCLLELQLQAR